ncbi:MAG TPA: ferredoxin [Polyangiales bacterium]|jgi:ferredoxin|nr:ferredoxin [Polyangiales bacterium]
MRLRIDDERCKGHGVCCGLCPEVFELTDDGYARVLIDDVPAELQDVVETAATQCPEGAISIEE